MIDPALCVRMIGLDDTIRAELKSISHNTTSKGLDQANEMSNRSRE